jgi:hypothetical protein
MLLLLVFLAGPAWAAPEPRAVSEVSVEVGTFDVLNWAWEWLTSLVSDDGTISSGGGHLSGSEGGMFIDPNGNS